MPDYPTFVLVTLDGVNGQNCNGAPADRLMIQTNSSPLEYTQVSGSDTFDYIRLWKDKDASGADTWKIIIRYVQGTPCDGMWIFQRTVSADDPTGKFCALTGNVAPDCNVALVGSTDDS